MATIRGTNKKNKLNGTSANDSDPENVLSAASITSFTQGAHGAVKYWGDGTFKYLGSANFSGTDSFSYTITGADFILV